MFNLLIRRRGAQPPLSCCSILRENYNFWFHVREIVAVVFFFVIVLYRQKVKPAKEQRARALIPPSLLIRQLRWREIARRRRGETNLIYEAARRRSSTCGWNQRLGVDKKHELREIMF